MNPTIDSKFRRLEEMWAYFDLGLFEQVVKQIAQYKVGFGSDPEIRELQKALLAQRGDVAAVATMAKEHFADSCNKISDLHAAGAAGDPEWAYAQCLRPEDELPRKPIYWFNRACFASRTGELRDAAFSLLKCFRMTPRFHADAFLDSDLNPLWTSLPRIIVDDDLAECLADPIWRNATRNFGDHHGELTLPGRQWRDVPETFRVHLQRATGGGKLVANPTMPGSVYRKYLEWQKVKAAPNARLLESASLYASNHLVQQQLRFALWQAKHGNFTAARSHILYYLSRFPGNLTQCDNLRKHGMAYLLDDLAPAIAEDPQFAVKMQHVGHACADLPTAREILDDIGEVGKQSAIFKLRTANWESAAERTGETVRLLAEVSRMWPTDATAYSRLTDIFIADECWKKARLCFRSAPKHYRFFWRHFTHRKCLRNKVALPSSSKILGLTRFFGQRNFAGGLRDGHFPVDQHLVPTSK